MSYHELMTLRRQVMELAGKVRQLEALVSLVPGEESVRGATCLPYG